jgi:hypothetical protein
LAFNKTVVLRYRFHLEERGLAPGTINVRMAAVRRLAFCHEDRLCTPGEVGTAEAADSVVRNQQSSFHLADGAPDVIGPSTSAQTGIIQSQMADQSADDRDLATNEKRCCIPQTDSRGIGGGERIQPALDPTVFGENRQSTKSQRSQNRAPR